MKKAVYPGSFDPITTGHVDIIERISRIFDEVIVLISEAPGKTYLFTHEERKKFIEITLKHVKNVRVDIYEGLTVDYVKKNKAQVMVRGLRAVVDFEYEMTIASMNQKLDSSIETMLVFASPEYYYVSSRGVKEVAKYGGSLNDLVPEHVRKPLLERLKKQAK